MAAALSLRHLAKRVNLIVLGTIRRVQGKFLKWRMSIEWWMSGPKKDVAVALSPRHLAEKVDIIISGKTEGC